MSSRDFRWIVIGFGFGAVLGLAVLPAVPGSPRICAQTLIPSIHSKDVPVIPPDLDRGIELYRSLDRLTFQGWLAGTRALIYLRESGGITQVMVRRRSDGPAERLMGIGWPIDAIRPHPTRDRLVLAFDPGVSGNDQLFLRDLATGQTQPFTNSYWRNTNLLWSPRGHLLAFTSNVRDGKDQDLYVVDPPDPGTGHRIKTVSGRCLAQDWSADERRLAALELRPDGSDGGVHLIDPVSRRIETLPPHPDEAARRTMVRWSRDARALYWLTTRGSEFRRLARYDLSTKQEVFLSPPIPHDVDEYALSGDGKNLVVVLNVDGRSRLLVVDALTGALRLRLGFPGD